MAFSFRFVGLFYQERPVKGIQDSLLLILTELRSESILLINLANIIQQER